MTTLSGRKKGMMLPEPQAVTDVAHRSVLKILSFPGDSEPLLKETRQVFGRRCRPSQEYREEGFPLTRKSSCQMFPSLMIVLVYSSKT